MKYTQTLAFLIFICLSAFSLKAQDSLEIENARTYRTPSVTVETNRAEERLMPVAYSEIETKAIKKQHTVRDLPYLMAETPSMIFYSESGNSIGHSYLNMRGFDQRRISVMINGIPQNDPEDHNFFWINVSDLASSIESIHIQRGAGISSYGAAAMGGSINLVTSNFVNDRGVKVYSGLGFQEFASDEQTSRNAISKFQFEYSSGLVDKKYSFYAKIARINSDGYRNHSYATLNSYFLSAARFDDNLTTQINIFGGSQIDGLAYTGLPKQYVKDKNLRLKNYNFWMYGPDGETISYFAQRRDQEIENFSQPQLEMLNDWEISDNVKIKSAVFYKNGSGFFDYDATGWTNAAAFRLNEENGYPNAEDPRNPIIKAYVNNSYGGWIPRMIYEHTGGVLTVGIEARMNRSERWGKIEYAENLPAGYDPDFKFYSYNGHREIYSIFAREQLYLTEKIALSAETQLVLHRFAISNEKDGKNYTTYLNKDGEVVSGEDNLFDINYVFFNPRLGATYNYNDFINIYASLAYTSREPRLKNLYTAEEAFLGSTPMFEKEAHDGKVFYDFSSPLVKPEKLVNTELGWRYRDSRYFFNMNFYWMEYFDELVKSGQVDIFGGPIDGNAPRSRHLGIELQATAKLLQKSWGDISISGNFTYSKNSIIEYDFETEDFGSISLADNEIAGFPEIMGKLRLTYEGGGFYATALMRYVGEFRTDNFGELIVTDERVKSHLGGSYYADNINDAYMVMDMNTGYSFKEALGLRHITVSLQVMNLTNNYYSAYAIGKEFYPAAEINAFLGLELGI